jgi:ankyrin repeat protein
MLIAAGVDVSVATRDGKTIWDLLYQNYNESNISKDAFRSIVQTLLENGADPNQANRNGAHAFHFMIQYRDANNIDLALRYGGDPNAMYNGQGILHLIEDDRRDINVLLLYGADCNKKDIYGNTALHYAAKQGYTENARVLIQYGIDMEARNEQNQTALDVARLHNQDSIAELIEHVQIGNADAKNSLNMYGEIQSLENVFAQPSHIFHYKTTIKAKIDIAARFPNIMYYDLCHQKKSLEKEMNTIKEQIDAETSTDYTFFLKICFYDATQYGNENIIKSLAQNPIVQKSINIWQYRSRRSNCMMKIIHFAARQGHPGVFEQLLHLGANPHDTSCNATPLAYAKQMDNKKVGRMIRDYIIRNAVLQQATPRSEDDDMPARPRKRPRDKSKTEKTSKRRKIDYQRSKKNQSRDTNITDLPPEMLEKIAAFSVDKNNTLNRL